MSGPLGIPTPILYGIGAGIGLLLNWVIGRAKLGTPEEHIKAAKNAREQIEDEGGIIESEQIECAKCGGIVPRKYRGIRKAKYHVQYHDRSGDWYIFTRHGKVEAWLWRSEELPDEVPFKRQVFTSVMAPIPPDQLKKDIKFIVIYFICFSIVAAVAFYLLSLAISSISLESKP